MLLWTRCWVPAPGFPPVVSGSRVPGGPAGLFLLSNLHLTPPPPLPIRFLANSANSAEGVQRKFCKFWRGAAARHAFCGPRTIEPKTRILPHTPVKHATVSSPSRFFFSSSSSASLSSSSVVAFVLALSPFRQCSPSQQLARRPSSPTRRVGRVG